LIGLTRANADSSQPWEGKSVTANPHVELPVTTFWQAFTAECRKKPFEFIALLAAIIGGVVAVVSLRDVATNLESQAYNYIITNQQHLDRALIDNSDYRPYFSDRKSPDGLADDELNKLRALADLKLDVIDGFYSQAEHIDWKHYTRPAWDQYYRDSFAAGPILCRQLCEDWWQYGSHIKAEAVQPDACGTTIQPPAKKPDKCKYTPRTDAEKK
jgi:hypothetical protein